MTPSSPDPAQLAVPARLTPLDSKNQHLYFTTQSTTDDGRWLVVISERTGKPNLFALYQPSGTWFQISRATALRYSYVYADGGESGFCKASPALDTRRNMIYWVQDNAVWQCHLGDTAVGAPRRISELPDSGCMGFSHVSADGRFLAIPIADREAFRASDSDQSAQMESVPQRMLKNGLGTRIMVVDTDTGDVAEWARIPFWVTHLQFCPTDSSRMIFNSEGCWTVSGDPHTRVWALDKSGRYRKLFHLDQDELASHENWCPNGSFVTSHGHIVGNDKDKAWIQAHSWDGDRLWRIRLGGISIAHATCLSDGRTFAIDDWNGWISLFQPNGADGQPSLRRICRHGSSFAHQDVHPHPVATADGEYLIFTSDFEGQAAVYRVDTRIHTP